MKPTRILLTASAFALVAASAAQAQQTWRYAFEEAIDEMFLETYAEHGLELLTMYPEGEMVMTTRRPVRSPADLGEQNIRVMTNPLLVEKYRAFGAVPTPLPLGEVSGALQTTMIQGPENPMLYVDSTRMYAVTDDITFTGHTTFTTAFMANQDFFDGLSDEDQQLVRHAVDVAFEYILDHQQGLTEATLEAILEARPEMEVIVLTEEQRQPFMDAAERVEEALLRMTGDTGAMILEQMKTDLEAVPNRRTGPDTAPRTAPPPAHPPHAAAKAGATTHPERPQARRRAPRKPPRTP